MTLTDQSTAPWALGYTTPEREFPERVELPVEGAIPTDVNGVLYRVGPAGHDVFGDRNLHPFDGDGMLAAFDIAGGRVHFRSRWIDTVGRRAERAAGRRLFGGAFATRPAGGPLARFRHRQPKNAANTNVVPHNGSLLALWEGGHPYRIDPVTLDTVGEDDLGGVLSARQSFSAHPHLDPAAGDLWNFGVEYGFATRLSLYRLAADSPRVDTVATVTLPRAFMIHDFAVTDTRVVFICPPIALPRVPLGLATGQRSYADSLRWDPSFGTRILVIDRASGAHEWHSAPSLFVFHLVGAHDDGDRTVVDLCAYADDRVMRTFYSLMSGVAAIPSAPPYVTRLVVEPGQPPAVHRLSGIPLEFPRTAGSSVLGVTATVDGHLGQPLVLDCRDWSAAPVPVGPGVYTGEPIPVSSSLFATVVLDGLAGRSELWFVDTSEPAAGPLARAALPAVMPFGLHGNWVPAS